MQVQTAIAAHAALIRTGKAASIEQRIKNMFVEKGAAFTATREEIAELMGVRLTTVCGRVKPLLKAGILASRGTKRNDSTGYNNETVGLPEC